MDEDDAGSPPLISLRRGWVSEVARSQRWIVIFMDVDVAVRIFDQVCSSVQAVVVAMDVVEACKLHRLPRA